MTLTPHHSVCGFVKFTELQKSLFNSVSRYRHSSSHPNPSLEQSLACSEVKHSYWLTHGGTYLKPSTLWGEAFILTHPRRYLLKGYHVKTQRLPSFTILFRILNEKKPTKWYLPTVKEKALSCHKSVGWFSASFSKAQILSRIQPINSAMICDCR